jgi:hypothetical protein
MDHRLSQTQCPWCETPLDSVFDPDERAAPKPGDLTVCIQCASLLMLDENLIPQKISEDERRQILLDQPDLVETLDQMQRVIRSLERRQ